MSYVVAAYAVVAGAVAAYAVHLLRERRRLRKSPLSNRFSNRS